ncbi:MAG TPA: response regulator transcription factor [Candidatus Acidoferrum sp.]|nr:response regulator transcription factor [Candidatus Acidoferrum sp.]
MNAMSKRQDVVLVVDDSPDTLSLVNDTLEAAGFSVLVALEGKQALTIARRIRPHMILLDAVMPQMDGFETCSELKKVPELAAIPVIFMTGLSDTEHVVKGLAVGGVDYLTKPINPDELVARMKVHLSNARLTSSAWQALDSTGQYLFSINADGLVNWATPQTYALFAKAKATQQWRDKSMTAQLQQWLLHAPEPNQLLMLEGLEHKLGVVYLQDLGGSEKLMKLLDTGKASGEELLKTELNLTARESQVLFWISNGKTNREIAEILGMSPRTVNKHLEQIFPKLGVENRTAAARVALKTLNRD